MSFFISLWFSVLLCVSQCKFFVTQRATERNRVTQSSVLFKGIGLTNIHIPIIEILTRHTPNKCVI
jgi:hypothetical protein